jgi:hypothetical protein
VKPLTGTLCRVALCDVDLSSFTVFISYLINVNVKLILGNVNVKLECEDWHLPPSLPP